MHDPDRARLDPLTIARHVKGTIQRPSAFPCAATCTWATVRRAGFNTNRMEFEMHNIIYIVGLIVIVLAILSFIGIA
ncbi:MAG: hypothetical protein AAFU50_01585 [Pseudomonadota bacterium]